MPDGPAATRAGDDTLLFVSRQTLLAETLGTQIAASGQWKVKVVGHDRPHLLEVCLVVSPTLVLVDVDDHSIPWPTLVSTLVDTLPHAGVVIMGDVGAELVTEAVARGARGCLTYSASIDEVLEALAAVRSGRTVVPPAELTEVIDGLHRRAMGHPQRDSPLSEREIQVLRLLTRGDATTAIAKELGISEATVRKHVQNILGKLGVHSKLQAAAHAARRGLV